MDNFDKLFQDKLNEINENDFEFKESSWERFHKNVDAEEVVSPRGVVPIVWVKRNAVAAAIILLLLTSNVFFAKQFLTTRSNVKALSETVENLKGEIVSCQENSAFANENENSLLRELEENKNSLLRELEENKSSLLRELEESANQKTDDLTTTSNFNNFTNNPTFNNNNPANNNRNDGSAVILNAENSNSNNGGIANSEPPNTDANATIEQSNPDLLGQANATIEQSIDELNRLNLVLNNANSADAKWWIRQDSSYTGHLKTSFGTKVILAAQASKPSVYQIGTGFQLTNITTANGIQPITMMNIGVSGNALFYNRLRLQIGTEWWTQNIHFENMETVADGVYSNILVGFPMLEPNYPQDKLTKLEGQVHGFDVPIMAEILLRPGAKFNPYLGFGVVGRYYDKYNLEHYFKEYNNPAYEYELKEKGTVQQFDFGLWQGKLGFDIRLSEHWLLNTELSYIKSYRQQIFGLRTVEQYGGRVGVKYEF
jgi:hypothetical protein